MGNQLALTNVVTISVSQANVGVGSYNTSNLAVFTSEVPANSFGSLGYAYYVTPTQVGVDFGTSSRTYAMALAVFSQQPNILTGGGQLIVILMQPEVQNLAFSGIAASGSFVFNFGGHTSAAINWDDTAAQIQAKLRAVTGLSEVTVTGSIASESVHVTYAGVYGDVAVATITSNTLATVGPVAITITVTQLTAGATLADSITANASVVQFFGIVSTFICAELGATDVGLAAAAVLPLNKMMFLVSNVEADMQSSGMLISLATGSFTNSRGLFYDDTSTANCLGFLAAYAGRALSTNFSGSNTTSTMHLKSLAGVQPDPNITQTILNVAIAAGCDTYISLQGSPAVFTSNANGGFFDQIYNLQWLVGALQVAGYNYLAQTGTKVPQTESGMDGLKGAYRAVCQQAVTNAYSAPGAWNSPTTFGNSGDLVANVGQIGYYIYSLPIAQQLQAARVARQSPLVQIALKEAGAIQSSQVIVTVNP